MLQFRTGRLFVIEVVLSVILGGILGGMFTEPDVYSEIGEMPFRCLVGFCRIQDGYLKREIYIYLQKVFCVYYKSTVKAL